MRVGLAVKMRMTMIDRTASGFSREPIRMTMTWAFAFPRLPFLTRTLRMGAFP